MKQYHLPNLILDQSSDLIWVVDSNLTLVYANNAYLALMKEVTGNEKLLNTPILMEGFGEGYIEKWKAYYNRALHGEYFEIDEHYYNTATNDIQYGHIKFTPVVEENGETHTVIGEKHAKISWDPLPEISTHKAPITQIFHSILDNGLKYSKLDLAPDIKVTAVEKKKEWEFAIIDNGIGIEP